MSIIASEQRETGLTESAEFLTFGSLFVLIPIVASPIGMFSTFYQLLRILTDMNFYIMRVTLCSSQLERVFVTRPNPTWDLIHISSGADVPAMPAKHNCESQKPSIIASLKDIASSSPADGVLSRQTEIDSLYSMIIVTMQIDWWDAYSIIFNRRDLRREVDIRLAPARHRMCTWSRDPGGFTWKFVMMSFSWGWLAFCTLAKSIPLDI